MIIIADISLQEIADSLNLSRVTVSKVINNKPGVSKKTRDKVLDKIFESEYRKINPQFYKKDVSIKTNKTDYIVILATYPEFSEFWMQIINSIASRLSQTPYDVIYSFMPLDNEEKHVLPQIVTSGEASGIIIINVYNKEVVNRLSKMEIPKVYLDLPRGYLKKTFNSDVILLDGEKSIYQITEDIIRSGKKRIGFIGDIFYCETTHSRWCGYEKAMNDYNISIPNDVCFTSDPKFHFYNEETITNNLDNIRVMPEAFVCSNDVIAFMVIDYLKSKGILVPKNIFVSGFDNIVSPFTKNFNITSVNVKPEHIGIRLLEQILLKIKYPQLPSEVIMIDSEVIFRESTQLITE